VVHFGVLPDFLFLLSGYTFAGYATGLWMIFAFFILNLFNIA